MAASVDWAPAGAEVKLNRVSELLFSVGLLPS